MIEPNICTALRTLGFVDGYATLGDTITVWNHQSPQPTEAELIAAGLVKTESAEEAPEE